MNKFAPLLFASLLIVSVSANSFLGQSSQLKNDPYNVTTHFIRGQWNDSYYTDNGEYVDQGEFTAQYRNYTQVNQLWINVSFNRNYYNGTRNFTSEDPFVDFYDQGGYTFLGENNVTESDLLPIIIKRLKLKQH